MVDGTAPDTPQVRALPSRANRCAECGGLPARRHPEDPSLMGCEKCFPHWPESAEMARLARMHDALPETDVYTEWGVDARDQPPMFACILAFESKAEAIAHAQKTGFPLVRRTTIITRRVGEWEPI